MKSLITLILVSLCVSANANTVELDSYPKTGSKVVQITVYRPITHNVCAFGYAYISEKWSEGYGGLVVNPTKWFEGALGFGKESTPNSWRRGGWIVVTHDRLAYQYSFETGTKGQWQKAEIRYRVSSRATLGYTQKTGKGQGPFVSQRLSSDVTLKVTMFSKNPEVALKVSF